VFTIDNDAFAGLTEYFDDLRRDGMRTVIILVYTSPIVSLSPTELTAKYIFYTRFVFSWSKYEIWNNKMLPVTKRKRRHPNLPQTDSWYSIYLPRRDGSLRNVTCSSLTFSADFAERWKFIDLALCGVPSQSYWVSLTILRDHTHCYLPPNASERAQPQPAWLWLGTRSTNPGGMELGKLSNLTCVVGYDCVGLLSWFTCQQTVTPAM